MPGIDRGSRFPARIRAGSSTRTRKERSAFLHDEGFFVPPPPRPSFYSRSAGPRCRSPGRPAPSEPRGSAAARAGSGAARGAQGALSAPDAFSNLARLARLRQRGRGASALTLARPRRRPRRRPCRVPRLGPRAAVSASRQHRLRSQNQNVASGDHKAPCFPDLPRAASWRTHRTPRLPSWCLLLCLSDSIYTGKVGNKYTEMPRSQGSPSAKLITASVWASCTLSDSTSGRPPPCQALR